MTSDTPWQKATAGNAGGDCVELRRHQGRIEVRDSKDPHGPVLRFQAHEIRSWIRGAANGEFDNFTN